MSENIIIKGAKTHNLKNISLEIPKHKVVVFTGVSGSGKSSLVFDTIYTEAQRQLIETFSSFARQRLPKLSRPDVDEINNISTAIVIEQKRMGRNLRSTVGTATEIITYLRLLFSRCGNPFIGPSFFFSYNHPEGMCPECLGLGKKIKIDVDLLLDKEKSLKDGAITHPEYKVNGWGWREIINSELFNIDIPVKDFSKEELNKLLYSDIIPLTRKHSAGTYSKNFEGIARRFERLNIQKGEDEDDESNKNAYQKYFIYSECDKCNGTRINERARSVIFNSKTIPDLINMEFNHFIEYLDSINNVIAEPLVRKMKQITENLINIGVGYLTLNRPISTLSGGESQRVKIARQLDCDLVDMMYILDEPTIGLHPRDNVKLIEMLRKLNEKGNSVFVIEHDPDIIKSADWIVDIGPKAGTDGGNVLFSGTFDDFADSDTITSKYLNIVEDVSYKRKKWDKYIEIKNATINNLKNISVKIPKEVLVCITGVAGSGKSSLINDVFIKENRSAIVIDQMPVGKSSRSNPATYIGAFDLIRKELGKATNSNPSLFSFNSTGACPKCSGMGYIKVEMSFLDDVKMLCDECNGKRYKKEVLDLKYKGKNIYDVLCMTISEAEMFFTKPEINKLFDTLCDVGLGYLEVGQTLSSLSGGEAQRIKLATELHKDGNIYVMDEPTTGLHMADTDRLLRIIKNLVNKGNSVIVIEHNLDIIKNADWVIDMGPEGGEKGGEVITQGTPEDIANCEISYTGQFLKRILEKNKVLI